MSQQPPGTFLPNTKVNVGSHKVYIERYLSEGGFAHVYVVRIPRDNHKHEVAVLKRVAVPDKEHLANMRTEVETMKKLKGHKHIVTYYDSHASQLKGGGYEVFLLMEFCSGGGLIDFMNTRLQHRLTEPEILKIFGDVAEGVATMHYLKPPLLHRDLKVENVLISQSSSGVPIYKVCDFGSTASPRPAAKTVEEGRLIEDDIQKHTTIQYRSPEMIDVWRKHPIDEKSDIWALGVLLYKLCYYTTPFEDVGQMAILNASFKFPTYPQFSGRSKKLVSWMLKEDPGERPNIYQVVKEVCSMRGTDLPIKDIYTDRTQSEVRRNETLPSPQSLSSAAIGLQKTTPQVQVQAIPEIAPMRRGRPPAGTSQASTVTKPASSPARGDPFAALDSKNYSVRAGAVDELSKRFPSLDEFSIVHDGGKFEFPGSSSPPVQGSAQPGASLNERVTNALADEVFSRSATQTPKLPAKDETSAQPAKALQTKARPVREREVPSARQPTTTSSALNYKSTGTGTSPPRAASKTVPEINNKPIWRVPQHERSTSQPRASEEAQAAAALLQPSLPPSMRPALLSLHRSKSQTSTDIAPVPTKPSGSPQPAMKEALNSSLARSGSVNTHARPSSVYVSSNMDFLRDQESSRKRPSLEIRRHHRQHSRSRDSGTDEGNISDDMEFLRNTEEQDGDRKRSSRPSHHRKHSGFNALSGAKNIITGRFGDAFKRFESHHTGEKKDQTLAPRTPEPPEVDDPQLLSPIAGSEATQSRHSDMESVVDETEDLPPEVRRELERTRLSQEEKRVAEAAAEHRARVALPGPSVVVPPSKANLIQDRVQSLLDEKRDAPAPRRTAEGYGKYTDNAEAAQRLPPRPVEPAVGGGSVLSLSKPPSGSATSVPAFARTQQSRQAADTSLPNVPSPSLPSQTQEVPLQRVTSRPSAPPKPQALRTGGKSAWPPTHSPEIEKPLPVRPSGLAALLAKDLEGVPDYSSSTANSAQRSNASSTTPSASEDLEADFSKRYPSLSGIEMVETEIKGAGSSVTRVKEM